MYIIQQYLLKKKIEMWTIGNIFRMGPKFIFINLFITTRSQL